MLQRWWVKPGLDQLLFEKPPDIPLNPRLGQTMTAIQVVKAADVAALERRMKALMSFGAACLLRLDGANTLYGVQVDDLGSEWEKLAAEPKD